MRKIDENGLLVCRIQARAFELSLNGEYSSPIFLRRFMNSNVAARMDKDGFIFEACYSRNILEEIEDEFGKTTYGREKYSREEMYWMGYLYRYWAYTYQKTSRQLYRIIKPKDLRELYFPYHSLDPAAAIERILEARGLTEADMITRGVALLKKLDQASSLQTV